MFTDFMPTTRTLSLVVVSFIVTGLVCTASNLSLATSDIDTEFTNFLEIFLNLEAAGHSNLISAFNI